MSDRAIAEIADSAMRILQSPELGCIPDRNREDLCAYLVFELASLAERTNPGQIVSRTGLEKEFLRRYYEYYGIPSAERKTFFGCPDSIH